MKWIALGFSVMTWVAIGFLVAVFAFIRGVLWLARSLKGGV